MTAPPDFRDYIDLSFWDLRAQDMIDLMVARATADLPEWVPEPGNTEVVLIERFAEVIEGLGFTANRLPSAWLAGLAALMGNGRFMGTPPRAAVTFTASTTGVTVPVGTVLRYMTSGSEPVTLLFTTDADCVLDVGGVQGTVEITGMSNTSQGNGAPVGTLLEVIDPLPYVDVAALTTVVAGGSDPEDADRFILRTVQGLAALQRTYARPEDMAMRVLYAWPMVARSRVIQRWDGDPLTTPGTVTGHGTVILGGSGGSIVAPEHKSAAMVDLQEGSAGHVALHQVDVEPVLVDVVATVVKRSGAADATVRAEVRAVLAAYLDYLTWPWEATIEPNEILARIDTAASVDYVVEVTTPATAITMGPAQLPILGTVTIGFAP